MKKWTLMFYVAGDNELAPIIVSQLKAIKDAGFHQDVDVLVHFDANELGVPTRIYDVNSRRKRKPRARTSIVGDGNDPFVRNMFDDEVKRDAIDGSVGRASRALKKAMLDPDSIKATDALRNFIGFCRENHQADHYLLFLMGHGMIVGNDAFLPDENPVSSINLEDLGEILSDFADGVRKDGGEFELLSLHSCSLSAIEVAYELKGSARFMMASEGPSFVGTWPYRQLLKKIFNIVRGKRRSKRRNKPKLRDEMDRLIRSLFFLTFFNARDFLLAGYPQDLALCRLDSNGIDGITSPIQELADLLTKALNDSSRKRESEVKKRGKRIRDLVLLAHWEAQSYWGESYTDLFDFCRCLRERCSEGDNLDDLSLACSNVMDKLEEIVIVSSNFGSATQYSHGLSIYFPWSRPFEPVLNNKDRKPTKKRDGALERYNGYAFTRELESKSWIRFLEAYFDHTLRQPRKEEENGGIHRGQPHRRLAEAKSKLRPFGVLTRGQLFSTLGPGDPPKPTPQFGPGDPPKPIGGTGSSDPPKSTPSTGLVSGVSSIKNYPFVEEEG